MVIKLNTCHICSYYKEQQIGTLLYFLSLSNLGIGCQYIHPLATDPEISWINLN